MWKFFTLVFKNMGRNLLRTFVTSAGIMFLVFVVTIIWSVIEALESATSEKKQNLKVVVTERWQILVVCLIPMPPVFPKGHRRTRRTIAFLLRIR